MRDACEGESLLKHKDPFWGGKLKEKPIMNNETAQKPCGGGMLRCSNAACENHKPDDRTYFDWSMPSVRVTAHRTIIDDVKTEVAYCFTCPICKADAEDFKSNHCMGGEL